MGGLPLNVDKRRLYTVFMKEGRIISINIVYNRNERSKEYGFIIFVNPRDAWKAILIINYLF